MHNYLSYGQKHVLLCRSNLWLLILFNSPLSPRVNLCQIWRNSPEAFFIYRLTENWTDGQPEKTSCLWPRLSPLGRHENLTVVKLPSRERSPVVVDGSFSACSTPFTAGDSWMAACLFFFLHENLKTQSLCQQVLPTLPTRTRIRPPLNLISSSCRQIPVIRACRLAIKRQPTHDNGTAV